MKLVEDNSAEVKCGKCDSKLNEIHYKKDTSGFSVLWIYFCGKCKSVLYIGR